MPAQMNAAADALIQCVAVYMKIVPNPSGIQIKHVEILEFSLACLLPSLQGTRQIN